MGDQKDLAFSPPFLFLMKVAGEKGSMRNRKTGEKWEEIYIDLTGQKKTPEYASRGFSILLLLTIRNCTSTLIAFASGFANPDCSQKFLFEMDRIDTWGCL
jgi:hypothetical protein